jgi:hypothetical protein
MPAYTMALKPDRDRVRLLLTQGEDELLRASLPLPTRPLTSKPARALLESLAIWLDTSLRVVLSAHECVDGFSLGLVDENRTAPRTVFYEVVIVERARRRPARLRGVDDFRDLRQLSLLGRLKAGGR